METTIIRPYGTHRVDTRITTDDVAAIKKAEKQAAETPIIRELTPEELDLLKLVHVSVKDIIKAAIYMVEENNDKYYIRVRNCALNNRCLLVQEKASIEECENARKAEMLVIELFDEGCDNLRNRNTPHATTINTTTPVPHNSPINLMHYIKYLHEKHNRTMGEHETTFYTLWENKLNTIFNTIPHECSFVRELTPKEIELLATAGITREDICIAVNEMLTTNTNHYYYWLTWKRNYQLFEMGDIDTMVSDCAMEKFIEITYDAMMSICRPLTTYEKTLLSKFNINNQAIVDAICAVRGGEPFDEVVHPIFRDIMWYEMRGYITSYQAEQACNIIINLIEDGLKIQPIQRKNDEGAKPFMKRNENVTLANADAKPDTDKVEYNFRGVPYIRKNGRETYALGDCAESLLEDLLAAEPNADAKPEKKSCDTEGLRKLANSLNEHEGIDTAILISDTFDTSNMNTLVEKLRSIALQVAVITGLPYEDTLQAVADIAVELVEG